MIMVYKIVIIIWRESITWYQLVKKQIYEEWFCANEGGRYILANMLSKKWANGKHQAKMLEKLQSAGRAKNKNYSLQDFDQI